jgi:leader peptidase (prepilin peptidase)/N-methyltransferase
MGMHPAGPVLAVAVAAAAGGGLILGSVFIRTGMDHLGAVSGPDEKYPRWGKWLGVAAGVIGAVATVRAGSWWALPALVIWASAVTAAAVCDGVTQRIPALVVRVGGALTLGLLVMASVITGDRRGLALAVVASAAAGAILWIGWRYAGAGFGDVRLSILGGLGLGHVTHLGLALGVAAVVLITCAQAASVLARGGDRRSTFPYGPALATGFLLAAAA